MHNRIGLSFLGFLLIALFNDCSNPVTAPTAPKKNPISITIWYYRTSVDVDSTTQLTGVVLYSDSTKDSNVIWSSSNTAIAEISSAGKVHGITKGKFTITAKSALDSAISWSINMSVETPISWVSKASMINSREKVSLCALNGKIYAIGGSSSLGNIGKIEEYDASTDTWKEKSVNIGTHSTVAAVTVGNKIYILRDSIFSTMSLSAYDPVTDSLYPKSAFTSRIFWFGIGEANGKIYVIGGATGSSHFSTHFGSDGFYATASADFYSNSTFEYDTSADTWREKAPIPLARAHLAIASVNGKIYAIGGQDNNYYYSRVHVFDPGQNTWSEIKYLPFARWNASAVAINNHIFVVGGDGNGGYVSNLIIEYDPLSDSWSTRTPFSNSRLNFGTCALDTSIFITGGYDGQGYLSSTLEGSF
jgi:N-acetylneuraminic acid mutarotase